MSSIPPPLPQPPPLPRASKPRRRWPLFTAIAVALLVTLAVNLALVGFLRARHRAQQSKALQQQRLQEERNAARDRFALPQEPARPQEDREGPRDRNRQREREDAREGMARQEPPANRFSREGGGDWNSNRRGQFNTANTPTRPPKVEGARAAEPAISMPGGVFTNALEVRLQTQASNAVIRYTLNGGLPGTNSPIYTAPLTLRENTLLQARAFAPDVHPSAVAAATYTFLDESLRDFQSNLPLVILNAHRQYIGNERYIVASTRFIRPEEGRTTLLGPADYEGRGDLKRRGHSSLRLPKASFTFKARDEDGDKVDFSPFGMPAESDWVLYAPYADKSLLRDVLAYEMSNLMGRYATRTRFVEVFLSRGGARLGRDDYAGLYVLEERIKRDDARVNIAKLKPEDNTEPAITGGYILKRDHVDSPFSRWGRNYSGPAANGEVGFTTGRDLRLFFVDPDEQDLSSQQKAWIAAYLNRLEGALYGSAFTDPTNGYAAYLDVDSFIDHHWLVESTKNIDGFRYSCYLTKDRGGKLKVEPAWDWNLSFGNADYYDAWYTSEWYYPLLRPTEVCWFERLAEDPDFYQRHIDRWAVLRTNVLNPDRISRRVDELAAELKEAQARNFRRWPILGVNVNPNHFVGDTWEEELDYLKKWFRARVSWIDRQFPAAPRIAPANTPGPAAPPAVTPPPAPRPEDPISLSTPSGQILFTLDGSDPRAPGGAAMPTARTYEAPVAVPAGSLLVARVRNGTFWSAPLRIQR